MSDQHDDLEELLDSALDDFQSLNLAPPSQKDGGVDGNKSKQQDSSPSLPPGVQGLGMGLPDLKSKKKGKQKVSKESHVAKALDELREQTREAVKGLESVTASKPDDLGKDAMMEDWVKQFEELAGSQVYLIFSPFSFLCCWLTFVLCSSLQVLSFEFFDLGLCCL
uniref:Peroxisome biogenesis protein 19-1 n=1 Tax=Rhizophora mucronata TaxID=61149 RepID=A0A2P2JYK8_RHIMU